MSKAMESPDLTDEGAILVERRGGVVTITLNRPERRNALTNAHFQRLAECFEEAAANPEDRVVVLTGAGDAFCAGADLTGGGDSLARLGQGPVARARFAREAIVAALALHRLAKPTIAAVNGVAAGAGCNLALGCDLAFAGASARFCEVFVNRGLALDYGGNWLLPRLVGLQRAKDIAFRGDLIDAREAERYGLVLEVVPDEELGARVAEYAEMLASKPPIALSLIKTGLNRAATQSFEESLDQEADAQSTCLGSDDFREAMKAWATKSPGEYTGR